MSDKLKVGLLAALVLVLAVWWWAGRHVAPQGDRHALRDLLVAVDTAALHTFTLVAPAEKQGVPMLFQRNATGWTATQEGHVTQAFQRPLNLLFEALAELRPQAMPGSDPAVVLRYALTDSLCAWFQSPQVLEGRPIRIGSTTQGPSTPTLDAPPVATAVMLEGDPNVYLVPGAFSDIPAMTFIDWIPKPMVNGDPANWDRLVFTFPGNVGYAMERQGDSWLVAGEAADQERVTKYLRALSRYYGNALADPNDTLNAELVYQLQVDDRTLEAPIFLGIFQVADRMIARSTLAPRWLVMPFDPRTELPRMFRAPGAFLPHGQVGQEAMP